MAQRVMWGFLAAALAAPLLHAASRQEIGRILDKAYQGHNMTQRIFYGRAKVHYRANGQAINDGKPGSWTLDADILCKTVKVRRGGLVIKGRRVYFVYEKKMNKLMPFLGPGVEVEIATGNNPVGLQALLDDIDRVFLTSQESLVDFVPSYWKAFLLHPDQQIQQKALVPLAVATGAITRPRILSKHEPPYTSEAQSERLHGHVILSMVVGKSGRVTRPSILRPLGLGLGDNAAQAVRTWKFKPATRSGKPIAVRVNVDVSFELHPMS